MPRWFTEGLAVHEETADLAGVGRPAGSGGCDAIKEKKLLPVADLDRGFIHPERPGAGRGHQFRWFTADYHQ